MLGWLALHARGVAFEVRDGTVDLAAPGLPAIRLDAVVVDGEVSSEALEATIEAHANLWRDARAHARIETGSLAASLELQIDGLEAAPLFERALAASPAKIVPAASAVTLAAETDGARAVSAQLSVTMPGLGHYAQRLTARRRRLARPPAGHLLTTGGRARRGRAEPRRSSASRDRQLQATGQVKAAPSSTPRFGRVDAGRVRAAALGLADDLGPVRELATLVQGGIALDLRARVAGDGLEVLADPARLRAVHRGRSRRHRRAGAGAPALRGVGQPCTLRNAC